MGQHCQLIYDFRTWKSLEGLGRSGSDEGFDVRGVQIIESLDSDNQDKEDQDIQEASNGSERLWLIQRKREKSISPQKLAKYAKAIVSTDLYGVIFAACCDFSKRARDTFLTTMRTQGVQEVSFGNDDWSDLVRGFHQQNRSAW